MKKLLLLSIVAALFILGCNNQGKKNITSTKNMNRAWLDSIIKTSDSTYSKPYKRADFVTAVFYVNKKDSSVCQVMKDSADSIRQIIIAKNNVRTFYGQYYANGGLQAELPLDNFGQYHGTGTFYYEDGKVQSTGSYSHGLKNGEWKVYNEKGEVTATDTYDKNGQQISHTGTP